MAHGLIGGFANVTFENSGTNCPRCGQFAPIRDGTYHVVNSVVRAFTASGVTREQVVRFRDIAKSVEAGTTSADQAAKQVEQLGGAFATLWASLGRNGTQIQTIVAVIALFLMIYYQGQSDADAVKLQATGERQVQVEQMMLEELRRQDAVVRAPKTSQPPKPQMQPPAPQQTRAKASKPNRHERRKAARLAGRQPPG